MSSEIANLPNLLGQLRGEGGFGHIEAKIDGCRGHGFWFGFMGGC